MSEKVEDVLNFLATEIFKIIDNLRSYVNFHTLRINAGNSKEFITKVRSMMNHVEEYLKVIEAIREGEMKDVDIGSENS